MMILNMSNKIFSIVIVNYKSEHILNRCLASIYKKLGEKNNFEIIIVNNDIKERLGLIQEAFPETKILNMDKNYGFGAGNNIGAKIAQGEFILFLNPDTEIISDNIADVFSLFSRDSEIGIIGGGLVNFQDKIQEWSAGFETNLIELVKNKLGFSKSKKIWQSEKNQLVDWVSGAVFFIKKEIFEKVGGFDEDFFMYFEDMDLCKRVRNAGKKILFYPAFCVKHKSGESYSQEEKKQKKDYYKSQEHYFKKHKSKLETWLVCILRIAVKF